MKTLATIVSLVCCSCNRHESSQVEKNDSAVSTAETNNADYPEVVQRVLPLFSRIGDNTNPQDFYAFMDEAGVVLKDSDFIYGGGNLGESWEGARLTGDWILYLSHDSLEPRAIWKTEIYKELKGGNAVFALPYFYRGKLVEHKDK